MEEYTVAEAEAALIEALLNETQEPPTPVSDPRSSVPEPVAAESLPVAPGPVAAESLPVAPGPVAPEPLAVAPESRAWVRNPKNGEPMDADARPFATTPDHFDYRY